MITPPEAQRLIRAHSSPLGTRVVAISDALGCVLAENVRSAMPLPQFDNSAMDGFAIRSQDCKTADAANPLRLAIVASVFAGDNRSHVLGRGEACRIMTGAPMPRGADTVIPKEKALVEGSALVVHRCVQKYQHVRRKGEEIRRNQVILKKGVSIHPGVIACLASVGKARVRVVRKPSVSVISTGDETVAPGARLAVGQIYDSNSYMIGGMLEQMGLPPVRRRSVKDHYTALANAVGAALRESDVLVVLGGVSVGDRDYLRSVLTRHGVKQVFWRVSQKPGKPIYFGVKGRRLVFGLPGNPSSAFTCFYLYVYPALRRLAGQPNEQLASSMIPLASAVTADDKRWLMLKGKTRPGARVDKLPRQGSHMVTSLAETDRIVIIPPERKRIKGGEPVTAVRLPHSEEES